MQVGLMAPQGWKGEYDGWDPADAWARTIELAHARRGPRLRGAVGLRSLPHGPAADRRDHVRVVHGPVGPGHGDDARPARPHGHLHRLPQPRPHGQDVVDHRRHQRRSLRARHRRRLEGGGVAGLRLRLPDHRRADGRPRRQPRGHPRDARARPGVVRRGVRPRPPGDQRPEGHPAAADPDHRRRQRGAGHGRLRDPLCRRAQLRLPRRARDRRADDARSAPAARPRDAIPRRSDSRSTPATRTCASRARRGSTSSPGSPRSVSTGSSASRPAGRRRPTPRRPSPRTAGRPA